MKKISSKYLISRAIETVSAYFHNNNMKRVANCDILSYLDNLLKRMELGGFRVNHEYNRNRACLAITNNLKLNTYE